MFKTKEKLRLQCVIPVIKNCTNIEMTCNQEL